MYLEKAFLRLIQELALYISDKHFEVHIQIPTELYTKLLVELSDTTRHKHKITSEPLQIEVNDYYGKAIIKKLGSKVNE